MVALQLMFYVFQYSPFYHSSRFFNIAHFAASHCPLSDLEVTLHLYQIYAFFPADLLLVVTISCALKV
jgi:hypothetical protein